MAGEPLDVEGLALSSVQAAATALTCWREAIGSAGRARGPRQPAKE